jgi:hypothetical protein
MIKAKTDGEIIEYISLFIVNCNSEMMILPLKKSKIVAFSEVKWYFPLVHLHLKIIRGCLCLLIMLLNGKITLLSLKTKNHLILVKGLFRHLTFLVTT